MPKNIYYANTVKYYDSVKRTKLTYEEEIAIIKKIQAGDKESKAFFIGNNIPLVISIISKMNIINPNYDDLIQEGIIALISAIDNFDITKGYHFSTYATTSIKQNIARYIEDNNRTVRLPASFTAKINKYNLALDELLEKLKRQPTIEEIADYMQESIKTINLIQSNITNPLSLSLYDYAIYGIEERSIKNIKPNQISHFINFESENPQEIVPQLSIKELYDILLQVKNEVGIKDRDFDIFIRNKICCPGEEGYCSTSELAKIYHVSRQSINQILDNVKYQILTSNSIKSIIDYDTYQNTINEMRKERYQRILTRKSRKEEKYEK